MLESLKRQIKGAVKGKCQVCGKVIESGGIESEVKVPGYTGKHEKKFCSEKHLKEWKEYVEEWENKNHKIPKSSKSCPTCMR